VRGRSRARPGRARARARAAGCSRRHVAVLAEGGWTELSIEQLLAAVAAVSGVDRTTIYRRWPTLEHLVAEAASAHAEQAIPIPDTGALVGDLHELARELATELGTPAGRGAPMRASSRARAAMSTRPTLPARHILGSGLRRVTPRPRPRVPAAPPVCSSYGWR
jgi:AcrR family transcriptional regulator